MLKLKLQVHKEKFGLADNIANKFKKPIIFYLGHKADTRNFLITFVIMDFTKKEFTYITSYIPENIKKVEKDKNEKLFKSFIEPRPHCTIVLNPDEDFYTFIDYGHYFYHVNYKKKVMEVITGEDLNCNKKGKITIFSSTNYKDDKNNQKFYFSALLKKGNESLKKTINNFYISSLDLKEIKKVYARDGNHPPHFVKKYKNFLFFSDFYSTKYQIISSGKIFDNVKQLNKYVLCKLYRRYKEENSVNPSNFLKTIIKRIKPVGVNKSIVTKRNNIKKRIYFYLSLIQFKIRRCFKKSFVPSLRKKPWVEKLTIKLEPNFKKFIKDRFRNADFKEICDSMEECKFTTLPGTIGLLNLKNKDNQCYHTTFSNAAHFEIDERKNNIYISSHNLVFLDRPYFTGPAAIDKFQLKNGKLIKKQNFKHKTGYRFTSHKTFYFKDKSYVATFGQPNRLFLIDGETMSLIHYEDIGKNCLSNQEDIEYFINYRTIEDLTVLSLEVSDDGEILFFIGYDGIYFYSVPERKILDRVGYIKSINLFGDVSLNQFYQRTTHSQYFE